MVASHSFNSISSILNWSNLDSPIRTWRWRFSTFSSMRPLSFSTSLVRVRLFTSLSDTWYRNLSKLFIPRSKNILLKHSDSSSISKSHSSSPILSKIAELLNLKHSWYGTFAALMADIICGGFPSANVKSMYMFSPISIPNNERMEVNMYFCVGVSRAEEADATKPTAWMWSTQPFWGSNILCGEYGWVLWASWPRREPRYAGQRYWPVTVHRPPLKTSQRGKCSVEPSSVFQLLSPGKVPKNPLETRLEATPG